MSSDPIKFIMAILYRPLMGELYSIIKSAKKIKRNDLEKKLSEKQILNTKDVNNCLKKLELEDFIRTEKLPIKVQYTSGPMKIQKNAPKFEYLIIFKNYPFNEIKNKYNETKKNLEKDLKNREEKKYICPNCKDEKDANLASRTDFKCKNCQIKFINKSEDVIDLRTKCNEIFDLLDELFKEEEKNSNTGINANYSHYLNSKYGKNFTSNGNDIFEEDPNTFINETINNLKDDEKITFYNLIEEFSNSKKNRNNNNN